MSLSLSECEAVVREIDPALSRGVIQKIHQPEAFILTFEVRIPGKSFSLLISVEPGFARLHISSLKFINPQSPYQFCQYLRSHLEGGRITCIEQEPGDRILYLTITKSSLSYVLVAALTGNQANIHVLNESRVILQSLKPSRLEVGQVYTVPKRSEPLPQSSPSIHCKTWEQSQSTHEKDADEQTSAEHFPVSAEIEERYRVEQESQKRITWYRTQTVKLRKMLKQAIRREQTLESDLVKAEKYREYQRYGELLKGQLHTLKPRQPVVQVVDYFDPDMPTLSLPLNELKDAVWNMEDYFRKYRKYVSAQEHLQPRLQQTKNKIESLKKELADLEKEELTELVKKEPETKETDKHETHAFSQRSFMKKTAVRQNISKKDLPSYSVKSNETTKKRDGQTPAKHYRTFESFDGLSIFVGKSAKDNDTLTLKTAKPDDLWLHARGCPGSHVVVRLEKATEVPHETLRDAATLALFYSDLKKSGKGEVIYTLRKFVKKSKGLKAGAVHVTREKSIWIEVKKERLDRLKGGV